MAAMVRDPADRASFEGHRTGSDERELERTDGDERLVREQPMEADGDAVADEEEERNREHHVAGVDPVSPQRDHGVEQGAERRGHDEGGDPLLGRANRCGRIGRRQRGRGSAWRGEKVGGHARSW